MCMAAPYWVKYGICDIAVEDCDNNIYCDITFKT